MVSNRQVNKSRIVLAILLLIFIVILNHLPWNLQNKDMSPDSGLYAYLGSAITNGRIPYRDVWEHKPPMGFYLNALAVLIFGQTPWAIWWFAVLWMAFIAILFFLIIYRMMGWLPAFVGSITFVIAAMIPEMYLGGNLMEVYAFGPQVLVLYAYYNFVSTRKMRWACLTGLAGGLLFMTRQTSLALGISAFLGCMLMPFMERKYKILWQSALVFGVGFLVPLGLGLVYWSYTGALREFLDALLFSGVSYTRNAPFFWSACYTAFKVLPKMKIGQLYGISLLVVPLYLFINRGALTAIFSFPFRKWRQNSQTLVNFQPLEATILTAFLALPLEVVFASLGGRNAGHYFLAMVPSLATIASYVIWRWERTLHLLKVQGDTRCYFATWTLLVLGVLIWNGKTILVELPSSTHKINLVTILEGRYTPDPVEAYVLEHSDSKDTVLVWHIHVGLNFVTNRRPPQRILYPALLFVPPEHAATKLEEFLFELQRVPPRLILIQERSSIGLPFVNVPVQDMCPGGSCMPEVAIAIQRQEVQTELERLRAYFLEHYVLDATISDWLVYRRK